MASMHDNAKLYTRKRCYNAATGPYECLSKPWWIKTSKHPIYDPRHNCELEVLNCGEEVFGKLQRDIEGAQKTVDIITWGFDPGMVLIRNGSAENGIRYGDLLKAVATRTENPVIVRLLVWHDDVLSHAKMKNNPGYYSSRFPTIGAAAGFLGEAHERFNAKWFDEMFSEKVKNIRLHVREVPLSYRDEALAGEIYDINSTGWLGSLYPTHHQKMVLIDYELPSRAVGYVMGHNSITDFWDTAAHKFQDPLRETFYRSNPKEMRSQIDKALDDAGYFLSGAALWGESPSAARQDARRRKFMEQNAFTAKPYQDVSMRVRGPILHDLNHNFCEGWSESRFANATLRNAFWCRRQFRAQK